MNAVHRVDSFDGIVFAWFFQRCETCDTNLGGSSFGGVTELECPRCRSTWKFCPEMTKALYARQREVDENFYRALYGVVHVYQYRGVCECGRLTTYETDSPARIGDTLPTRCSIPSECGRRIVLTFDQELDVHGGRELYQSRSFLVW